MRLADTAKLITIATVPAARQLRKVAAMSRDMITVARFARMMGAGEDWTSGRLSALGRTIAAAYRKATGTEPRKAWDVTPRGIKRNMAYRTDADNMRIMTTAIRAYAAKNSLSLDTYAEAA